MRLKKLLLANKLPYLSPKINHSASINDAYLTTDMLQNAFHLDEEIDKINEVSFDEVSETEEVFNCDEFYGRKAFFDWKTNHQNIISKSEEEALSFVAGYIA